jgi:hypothetical protein
MELLHQRSGVAEWSSRIAKFEPLGFDRDWLAADHAVLILADVVLDCCRDTVCEDQRRDGAACLIPQESSAL